MGKTHHKLTMIEVGNFKYSKQNIESHKQSTTECRSYNVFSDEEYIPKLGDIQSIEPTKIWTIYHMLFLNIHEIETNRRIHKCRKDNTLLQPQLISTAVRNPIERMQKQTNNYIKTYCTNSSTQ
jgi:hypothetical protein